MLLTAIPLVLILLRFQATDPQKPPLLEFSYTDTTSALESTVRLTNCNYVFGLMGSSGHSGGFRIGAQVWRQGDTIFVRVMPYVASFTSARRWQRAMWRLTIAGLEPGPYRLAVFGHGDTPAFDRTLRLLRQEHADPSRCAA